MSADEIVWEDPPPHKKGGPNGRGHLQRLIAELKKHPGKWAVVRTDAPGAGGGSWTLLKARGLELTSRKNGDGTWTIYARWPEDAS